MTDAYSVPPRPRGPGPADVAADRIRRHRRDAAWWKTMEAQAQIVWPRRGNRQDCAEAMMLDDLERGVCDGG